MSVIRQLQRPFMPKVYDFVTGQKIDVPTISGPLLLDIGTVEVLYVHTDSFSVDIDSTGDGIALRIDDLDILIGRLAVNVHQTVAGSSFSCVYHTTPNVSDWDFSMAISAVPNSQCNLEILTNRSKVHIAEGHTHFNWESHSFLCRAAFRIVDGLIDIEQTVKKLVVRHITKFIDRQLQRSLNDIFSRINYIEMDYRNWTWIELCFSETTFGADFVRLGVTFEITEDTEPALNATSGPDGDALDVPDPSDEQLLLNAMAIGCALCWIWGFFCWFCCRKCYKVHRDSDEYERKWAEKKRAAQRDKRDNIERISSASPNGQSARRDSRMEHKFNPIPSVCNFHPSQSEESQDTDVEYKDTAGGGKGYAGTLGTERGGQMDEDPDEETGEGTQLIGAADAD